MDQNTQNNETKPTTKPTVKSKPKPKAAKKKAKRTDDDAAADETNDVNKNNDDDDDQKPDGNDDEVGQTRTGSKVQRRPAGRREPKKPGQGQPGYHAYCHTLWAGRKTQSKSKPSEKGHKKASLVSFLVCGLTSLRFFAG